MIVYPEPDSSHAPETRYPLPEFLEGIITQVKYNGWLRTKAWGLLRRDRRRKLPFALNADITLYKDMVHKAICAAGTQDPYTGETLQWELIDKWDPAAAKGNSDYIKQFYLLPTVDHVDPCAVTLEFEKSLNTGQEVQGLKFTFRQPTKPQRALLYGLYGFSLLSGLPGSTFFRLFLRESARSRNSIIGFFKKPCGFMIGIKQ
jgi:hypothetical protein